MVVQAISWMPIRPFNHSHVASLNMHDETLFFVLSYLNAIYKRFDSERFHAMRFSGDVLPIQDAVHGGECDTAFCPWRKL